MEEKRVKKQRYFYGKKEQKLEKVNPIVEIPLEMQKKRCNVKNKEVI